MKLQRCHIVHDTSWLGLLVLLVLKRIAETCIVCLPKRNAKYDFRGGAMLNINWNSNKRRGPMQCIRCANEIITNVVQSNGERYVTTLTGALRRVVLRFAFCQPFRIFDAISRRYEAMSFARYYASFSHWLINERGNDEATRESCANLNKITDTFACEKFNLQVVSSGYKSGCHL